MTTGRPRKYKPEYCQELIDFMSDGKTIEQFAAHLNVCVQTLYNWFGTYKPFLEAKKTGQAKSYSWWFENMRGNLFDKSLNTTGWYMVMKNVHGYSDNPIPKDANLQYTPLESFSEDQTQIDDDDRETTDTP